METKPPGDAPSIWVVTDGRAGNRAQAMGLAEAIARRRPAAIEEVKAVPRDWIAKIPPRLWHMARWRGWPASGYHDLVLPDGQPDLVIGAGRRVAPLVASLGAPPRTRTVQILDPKMPASAFDLIVAPEHDRLRADNALSTIGSIGRLTPERIAEAADALPGNVVQLPSPRLAVLLGGPSGSARWKASDSEALIDALTRLMGEGISLLITPSRRTPESLLSELGRFAGEGDRAFVWDGREPNPYPGILGLADAILVTEDSVNMASEAASTGKPLHLFPLTRVARKIRRFHEGLVQRGAARRFAGGIGHWTYEPLAEADRIAAEIDVRFLPD